jgi:hypothetical protein
MLAPARCAAGASTRCAAGVLRKSPHGRQSQHAAAGRAQIGSRRGAQVVGIVAAGPARRRQEHREPVLRPTAGAVAATGLVLAVAANIHGAALLIGNALGLLTTGP